MIQLPKPREEPTEELLQDFKDAILEYYKDPSKDPYNPDHLWETYKIYFNFLRLYANPRIN